MQIKLNNQKKNERVNVGKIINGTCVVLMDNIQHFSNKTNPQETLQQGTEKLLRYLSGEFFASVGRMFLMLDF